MQEAPRSSEGENWCSVLLVAIDMSVQFGFWQALWLGPHAPFPTDGGFGTGIILFNLT